MSLTVFGVVGRLLMILVLLNLGTIIRWIRIVDDSIHQYTTTVRCLFTGTVPDIIEKEHCSLPPPIVENPADTRNGPRTSQQGDTPPADTCAPYFRYYVGPALYCTQPLPPPPSVIIASNFAYPPPPLLQYYIGPAIFDITGPPPSCVAESKFEYPLPPIFAGSRRPLSYPLPSPDADDCPVIRWSDTTVVL